ncbi:MAG: CHAT domain-containing protein [Rhodocyclaceae bacterium]|nr:CHAT domain-containing protein [Rhodocyclaceae bacterium]
MADLIPLFDKYTPDQAQLASHRQELGQEPPQNAGQGDLGKFYFKRGVTAFDLGENTRAMQDLKKVLELGSPPERIASLSRLGWLEFIEGDPAKGLDTIKRGLEQIPAWHGGRLDVLGLYAIVAAQMGRLDLVGPTTKEIIDVVNWNRSMRAWHLFEHLYLERQNRFVGFALKEVGKLTEAEAALREALRQGDLDVPYFERRRNAGLPGYSTAERDLFRTQTKAMLAEVLAKQGRTLEAELLMRESLREILSGNGPPERLVLILAVALETLTSLDRLAEAEAMAKAGLGILARTGAKPDGMAYLLLRRSLADAMAGQGRYEESAKEALALAEAVKTSHPWLSEAARLGSPEIGLALGRSGKAEQGLAMLDAQYASSSQWRGREHPRSAVIQGYRGVVRWQAGEKSGALNDLRAAVEILLAHHGETYEQPAPGEVRRFGLILDTYLSALGDAAASPPSGLDPVAEAFRLADALRSRKIQTAISASAVRAAADTPELAALVRKLQDLGGEEEALIKILFNMSMLPPEKQLPKVMEDMRKRLEAIKPERAAFAKEVRTRFPAYAELVRPSPASIQDIQTVLQAGEAFIYVLPTEKNTLVWAIPKNGKPAFVAARIGTGELEGIVRRLRESLDIGSVGLDQLPPFDLQAAHRLYSLLLAPVAAGWEGASHLFVSSGGSLSQLPMAVLPTASVKTSSAKPAFSEYRKVPWLIRKAAITELPSASALIALRKMKPGSQGRSVFVGFGDPDFGAGGNVKTAMAIRRNLAVTRAVGKDIAEQNRVDWLAYSQLPPLPDTREELLAVAQALGAKPEADVYLGSKASKKTILGLNLADRRIVAFATHGLLAGDFPGLDQPALAMASSGSADEGLLKLEEILKLKLDADWVVLSACNTAAGDGEGAEAISGLGRGFFYAGARALLATHWPVETVSAKELVKGIFSRYSGAAGLSRAESLRRAMLAMIDETAAPTHTYAHPMFWAPYAVIGDGGNR